ncbi:hypothetical protein B0T20DRAFT_388457 [Sordaria brevicollis]|uniref:Uncharacterized protein n=1 Tax=Sordaria brevicollis TaxID=83679 RepID=A0AAE0UFZ9_SORBR|nr:hypothetical protein B0T20DRAFT_388457 [Sordaria brevicollis]
MRLYGEVNASSGPITQEKISWPCACACAWMASLMMGPRWWMSAIGVSMRGSFEVLWVSSGEDRSVNSWVYEPSTVCTAGQGLSRADRRICFTWVQHWLLCVTLASSAKGMGSDGVWRSWGSCSLEVSSIALVSRLPRRKRIDTPVVRGLKLEFLAAREVLEGWASEEDTDFVSSTESPGAIRGTAAGYHGHELRAITTFPRKGTTGWYGTSSGWAYGQRHDLTREVGAGLLAVDEHGEGLCRETRHPQLRWARERH